MSIYTIPNGKESPKSSKRPLDAFSTLVRHRFEAYAKLLSSTWNIFALRLLYLSLSISMGSSFVYHSRRTSCEVQIGAKIKVIEPNRKCFCWKSGRAWQIENSKILLVRHVRPCNKNFFFQLHPSLESEGWDIHHGIPSLEPL